MLLNNYPFLGICLGLQILFSESEESKRKRLNIFSEKIKKFSEFEDKSIKIPHMGWNQVEISQNHFLLEGIKSNEDFYFVTLSRQRKLIKMRFIRKHFMEKFLILQLEKIISLLRSFILKKAESLD